ncbi:MAG: gluconate 2-dehydrogenase subunit 3 family protein [Bryobacteraceae bacterium]|jgi:gluconate 2-dehydrogenase gamma chain
MPDDRDPLNMTRRTLIATATFVPLAALTAKAQTSATALSPAQLKTLEAFIDRIVPKDELGPGAVECGAATYIDRSLAGALASEKTAFLDGLAGVDSLARSTHNAAFADLTPELRDQLLTSMDNGTAAGFPVAKQFFARVRRLTLEGMFSDPYYGGNKNFAGWDLIRYPGPRLAAAPDDQKMSTPPKPYRKSAYGTGSMPAGDTHGH